MQINQKGSEVVGLVAAVNPVSQGAGAISTGWLSAKDFHRWVGIITAGVMGAAATIDAKFQQATDNGGTGVKDVAGRAITQMVKATDDNKAVLLDLKREDLDSKNGFVFFRLTITDAVAASLLSGHVLGLFPSYGPASDKNGALVKEVD